MMLRNSRTFTAIARRSMLGSQTTAPTYVLAGQSLRLFASKHPNTESSSFEVPLDSQDKLTRAISYELTRTAIHRMKNDQLKAELEKRSMPADGTKTERAERLLTVVPSKRGAQKTAAPTIKHITNNHTTNNHKHFNSTTNNITNIKNETVYQEIIPINDLDEQMPAEESNKEPGPVEMSPTNNDRNESTSSEDSNKEPGPVDPERNYILRVKGVSTKYTGGTGVGIVLEDSDDPTSFWTARKFLSGDRSLFEAEYTGLLVGLRYCVRRGVRNIRVEIDHDVTTGQMTGIYEVTKPELIPMYQAIMKIKDSMQSFSISHIAKKKNHNAKDLADKALATGTSVKIEDSFDPVDSSQLNKGQKHPDHPNHPTKPIELHVPMEASVFPSEVRDREAKKEQQKLPEQQQEPVQEPVRQPAEKVISVETKIESSVAETVQPGEIQIDPNMVYTLEFDGGARGNGKRFGGKSGAGAVIYDDRGVEVWCGWKFLQTMTNNCAEYESLLLGLRAAKSLGIKRLAVFGDSQLIVRQINGQNKVSNPKMKEYWRLVKPLMRDFQSIKITHFLRELNKRADQLANHAMDTETTHAELRRFDEAY
jgi:ribonuclease HI